MSERDDLVARAITTQNIEVKAIRDRLEEIFEILKGED